MTETTPEIAARYDVSIRRIDYLSKIGVLKACRPAKRRGMPRSFTYGAPAEVVLVNALLDNRMFNRINGTQLESLIGELSQAVSDGRTTLLLWMDMLKTESGLKWQTTCEFVRPDEVVTRFMGSCRIGFVCIHLESRTKALTA